MTPHPDYLRGIQAAMHHISKMESQIHKASPDGGRSLIALNIISYLGEFMDEQSTPPAVAEQEGGQEV